MLPLLVFIACALTCVLILCIDMYRRLKRFEASTTDTFNRLWSSLRPDAPPPALEKVRYLSEVISPSRRRQQRLEEEENDEP